MRFVRLIDARVAGLAPELLAQLTLRNAECAARDCNRPAHAGFFSDHPLCPAKVEEGRREHIGIVEVLNEGVSDALLTGRSPRAPVATILGYQEHLAGVGDRLEKNIVERVGNTTKLVLKTLEGISHPLRVKRQILSCDDRSYEVTRHLVAVVGALPPDRIERHGCVA
jgi:hypothetical protein